MTLPKPLSAAAAVVAAVILCVSTAAREVFVDPQRGDDAAAGDSRGQSVRTLDRGVGLCRPGDTLVLLPGPDPWPAALVFRGGGGLPGRPIVVEGNGAVLSGLRPLADDAWLDRGNDVWFQPSAMRRGSQVPFLVDAEGVRLPHARALEALDHGQQFWSTDGVFFRPHPGRRPSDYRLRGTALACGVEITDASHIVVRNLTCEHFANDGFNVHGSCMGLLFQNIVGRHNGDDGFSVHEDVEAVVQGGWFHGNTYGIQDINASRSIYTGVLSEHNRSHGVHFSGGFHSLSDSVVRENADDQVRVEPGAAAHLGMAADNPLLDGVAYLYNTIMQGGRRGLAVGGRARVAARACTIVGPRLGVATHADAVLHLGQSVVTHCAAREVEATGAAIHLDANLYHPGRLLLGQREVGAADFAAHQAQSSQDRASLVATPVPAAVGAFRLASTHVIVGDRQLLPGVRREPSLPFALRLENPFATAAAPAQLPEHRYDFESANPWCRVYPDPETNRAGQPVVGVAELSDEHAASGRRSVRLDVQFPPGEARTWLVKLFSIKFDVCDRPVRRLAFKLLGDGSGLRFRPRVRDRSGECFYGPEARLTWTGWESVVWDLDASPPSPVNAGDGNGRQDGPPMEIVLELFPEVPATGSRLVVFVDDLAFDLAPPAP